MFPLYTVAMRAFDTEDVGTIVQTVAFVLNKCPRTTGLYVRAVDGYNAHDKEQIVLNAVSHTNLDKIYCTNPTLFKMIPNSPIAYWASISIADAFAGRKFSDIGEIKTGLQTGNNDLFLKFWYEVSINNISLRSQTIDQYLQTHKKWIPQVKGGEFRRWYGNFDYVLDWSNDGLAIRNCKSSRLNAMLNSANGFKEGISWSHTSDRFGVRYLPCSVVFNVEAPSFFADNKENLLPALAFLNSKVARYCMDIMNSTLHFLAGDAKYLPWKDIHNINSVRDDVQNCLNISKSDWDSFETSWDFKKNPLV